MKNEEKQYYTLRDIKKMCSPTVPQDKPYYSPKDCWHLQVLYGLSCVLGNAVDYIERVDEWIDPDFIEVWGDEYKKIKESLSEISSGINEYLSIANEFEDDSDDLNVNPF